MAIENIPGNFAGGREYRSGQNHRRSIGRDQSRTL